MFKNRYQKTSFSYSLMLSFLYLPLVIGILESNQFINHRLSNLIVFITFSVVFITTINYKIMLSIKDSKIKFNRLLFILINSIIISLFYLVLPFEIEKNIFTLSFLVLIFPWVYYFRKIYRIHRLTL